MEVEEAPSLTHTNKGMGSLNQIDFHYTYMQRV